jgi:hypothetical protein
MRVSANIKRSITLLTVATLFLGLLILPETQASAKTVAEWLEGYDTGSSWFGDDFDYDITNVDECWDLLMQPITVLDVKEIKSVYPLKTPGGDKVNDDKLGGFINGASAAVHVLGDDEDGWTLIEGIDYYNRIIRGYVKTKLLKTVTPNEHYGVIVDKLTQRLYVFIDGEYFSSCAVSTGLPNDDQPYNETAAGEYLAISWCGGFDSEGMYCDMAIRFNNGDKMHEVPCNILADGTKRYTKWEYLLGTKASHGCIRVARLPNEDGLDQKWLWNNLKVGTKIVIWDDAGREVPYPDDDTLLYYNPDGGQYYHSYADCASVKSKYCPMTAFPYYLLDTGIYKNLVACPSCTPVKRMAEIDEENLESGVITQDEYDRRIALHEEEVEALEAGEDYETVKAAYDAAFAEDENVEITIIPADDSATADTSVGDDTSATDDNTTGDDVTTGEDADTGDAG